MPKSFNVLGESTTISVQTFSWFVLTARETSVTVATSILYVRETLSSLISSFRFFQIFAERRFLVQLKFAVFVISPFSETNISI